MLENISFDYGSKDKYRWNNEIEEDVCGQVLKKK